MSGTPGPEEFARWARRYEVVPVWRDLLADTETPTELFRRVGTGDGTALLESAEAGRPESRFSFLALDPVTCLVVRDGQLSWTDGPICPVPEHATLPETLQAVARRLRAPALPDVPGLIAGAVCVLGGDAWRGPAAGPSPSPVDSAVLFPGTMIVFDHLRHQLRLIANVRIDSGRPVAEQYADAQARLDDLTRRVTSVEKTAATPLPPVTEPEFDAETDDRTYRHLIEQAHRQVVAGAARQVNVSRRFVAPGADPLTVYRLLRITNPSPFMYLVRLPGVTVVGSSPQRLVSVRDRQVVTYALAGTRPRGDTPAEDAKLATDLLDDAKERAEHAMLVELANADLASVARAGTVRVSDRERIVRYSRVMHLVTEVVAELGEDRSALDALGAVFPAGTVTGVPRPDALRIIDELEPRPRGLYGGAVGYLDFAGHLDACIGIRTLQFFDGRAYCQAAAGVVAGSDPDLEVAESRNKARALFVALATARRLQPDQTG